MPPKIPKHKAPYETKKISVPAKLPKAKSPSIEESPRNELEKHNEYSSSRSSSSTSSDSSLQHAIQASIVAMEDEPKKLFTRSAVSSSESDSFQEEKLNTPSKFSAKPIVLLSPRKNYAPPDTIATKVISRVPPPPGVKPKQKPSTPYNCEKELETPCSSRSSVGPIQTTDKHSPPLQASTVGELQTKNLETTINRVLVSNESSSRTSRCINCPNCGYKPDSPVKSNVQNLSKVYYPPNILCEPCGGYHQYNNRSHLGLGMNSAWHQWKDIYTEEYVQPNHYEEHLTYDYGLASPCRPVKIIEEKDCLGGCLVWDEVYNGYIVGHEWERAPERRPPPRKSCVTWYPLLLFYQSHE